MLVRCLQKMSKKKLRGWDFLNSEEAWIALEKLDADAFERDNMTDLPSAFQMFKANRDGCMCYMMRYLSFGPDYEWRLRTYPPFLLECVEDAVALDRWASGDYRGA